MLSVSLFGSLLVELVGKADSEVIEIPPRSRALLAVLALGVGRSFTRTELLQIIWGESDRGGSSGSLNTALWRLRSAIERSTCKANEFIRSDHRGAIGLAENVVRLDVVEFQSLATPALGKSLELTDADDIARVTAALIDGLWLRAALSKDGPDPRSARQMVLDYYGTVGTDAAGT